MHFLSQSTQLLCLSLTAKGNCEVQTPPFIHNEQPKTMPQKNDDEWSQEDEQNDGNERFRVCLGPKSSHKVVGDVVLSAEEAPRHRYYSVIDVA